MRFTRDRKDERPFEPGEATLPHFGAGREYPRDATESMRARARQWAESRGLPVVDSVVLIEDASVQALVPLVEMTPGTATVCATAPLPFDVTVTIEPRTWRQRLRLPFGAWTFESGDAAFDDRWHVETTDLDRARVLLGLDLRRTLLDLHCWCRVTYRSGDVEVLLDTDDMAGTHVLAGAEVALLLAAARPPSGAAYR